MEGQEDHKQEGKKMGETEQKLNWFVNKAFESVHGPPPDKEAENYEEELAKYQEKSKCISRTQSAQLFYTLMVGHNYGDAWDDDEFRKLYSLFEDDQDHSVKSNDAK